MGPTASGKTNLAIALAQHLPLEIISVDSAMIYKGMDIGTAKPTAEELAKAPHHLLDILDPSEHYSAGQFVEDAKKLIVEIHARGKIPFFVGGTMLYFKALSQGIAALPERDLKIRQKIEAEALQYGWPYQHAQLAQIDPEAAARIKPNDKQRIERALEVYYLTNTTISSLQAQTHREDLELLVLAINPLERKILHERIQKRTHIMLAQGFIHEVEQLKARADLSLNMASMRAVGYRQVWEYLDGNISQNELEERIIIATRQYAKRQLTWLRSFPKVSWFDSEDLKLYNNAHNIIEIFLKQN